MTVNMGFSVNDSVVSALLRMWKGRYGQRLTSQGERQIRRAVERIERDETSLAQELDRLRPRK